ncbi:hypothetical protein SEVCU013_0191 [Staphylococcus epidermidis VCU013]|nr:hypothetical protein SEVCU013_0191 [Staphylococcus epidermidis VCU013]
MIVKDGSNIKEKLIDGLKIMKTILKNINQKGVKRLFKVF